MTDDLYDSDETELFEHEGYVCALRTTKTKHSEGSPWFQGVMYRKDGTLNRSNWYTKPEDAIKMAKVMARQEGRQW